MPLEQFGFHVIDTDQIRDARFHKDGARIWFRDGGYNELDKDSSEEFRRWFARPKDPQGAQTALIESHGRLLRAAAAVMNSAFCHGVDAPSAYIPATDLKELEAAVKQARSLSANPRA